MDFGKVEIESGRTYHKVTGRKSDCPPAKIASKILEMENGDSFVIDAAWRSRIYTACYKNRPLAVSIENIGNGKIRVWRIA